MIATRGIYLLVEEFYEGLYTTEICLECLFKQILGIHQPYSSVRKIDMSGWIL